MSENQNQPTSEDQEQVIPAQEPEDTEGSANREASDNNQGKQNQKKEKKTKSVQREIIEWIACFAIAVSLALIIRNFFFTLVLVDGHSMDPTLADGQRLVVSRFLYEPKDGDIIVFHPHNEQDKAYVKRVIATEGETVRIDYETDTVYVNGVPIEENYINDPDLVYNYGAPNAADEEITVPEDCVFVMGDNRNNSRDSRTEEVGFVTKDSIVGKAQFRLWPFNAIGGLY